MLPEGLVPYASVGQQNVRSGNLSDNISRAVEMMTLKRYWFMIFVTFLNKPGCN